MPLVYKGVRLEAAYRVDMLVDKELIVALKSVAALLPVHQAQVLSYLRLSGRHLGLLINFNVPRLKDGIKRLVNDLR